MTTKSCIILKNRGDSNPRIRCEIPASVSLSGKKTSKINDF
jgi:hypothetical protein